MTLPRRRLLALATAALAPFPALAATPDSLTLGITRDIQGALDPATRLSALETNILKAVCPGLIAFRPGSFDWQPALAAAIAPEGDTAISFTLHEGLQFHAGFGPVTAEDVKFSFERFRTPGPDGRLPTYATDWEALDHVEVTGPLAGRIHLKAPAPMLWRTVLPDGSGCIISRAALAQGAYRADQPPLRVIGAGAYSLAEWVPNQRIVLHGGAAAHFRQIVLRPVRDPRAAELALRADEVQFIAIDPQNVAVVGRQAGTTVLRQDSINMVWLGLNVEHPKLSDLRVRQAIRAAIDVDQVVEGAWNGSVTRADGPIAPGLLGYWKDAPHRAADVATAKRLLAEAGVAGLRLKLTLLNQPAYQQAGVILQAMLAEAGIGIDLDIQDGGAFWSAGSGPAGRALELSLQRFGGKADPAFQMQWFLASQIGEWNWQRWADPAFDKLTHDAAATSDDATRARLYVAAQQRMDASAAFVWLTHEAAAFGFRDWLRPSVLPNGDDLSLDQFSRVA